MDRLKTFFLLLTVSLFFFSTVAQAKPIQMLIWYPGGEGDEEAAGPILNDFANEVKQASNGKIELQITYSQNPPTQLPFNPKQNPYAVGIVAYEVYLKYKIPLSLKPVAKTLPLPAGKDTERYYIVGNSTTQIKDIGRWELYTHRPYEKGFLLSLFPELANYQNLQIKSTLNLIGTLKEIQTHNYYLVVLDAFSHTNLKNLNFPWVKSLVDIAVSKEIPSAPVVQFNESPEVDDLTKVLISLKPTPVLKQLRLKGFFTIDGSTP